MTVRITLTIEDMGTGTQATKEAVAMALERFGKVCVLEVTPIIQNTPKQESLW